MAITVSYDSDCRMILSGLECGCPCEHHQPNQDIYVGRDLLQRVPGYIKKRGLGEHCVLVCDNNTYEVAGRRLQEILTGAGLDVQLCRIVREGEMMPDETAVGEVLLTVQPETQFLIAVGSGSVTDTTRVNAARTGLPFVSVGTAASMDGYTSVVAPLLLRGVKIHRQGPCPEILVCDLDILATASLDMVISGFGDVLGKYIAIADWKIGGIINDEPYCPACGDIVLDAVGKLIDNVDEIRARTETGMRVLIEALLLAGITIMIVGHTRAVASVEHNVCHYVEMRMLARHGWAPKHGSTVGASTLLVWPLFKRFAQEDLSGLNVDALEPMDRALREKWMLYAYGEEAAQSIMRENPGDFLTREELHRRARRAVERFGEIKAVIDELPEYAVIEDAMRRLGAPMTLQALGVEDDIVNTAMRCAKDYRTRYTLLKTIDEVGLQEKYMADYPDNF